ncbi:MAG: DUF3179 domain-containing protein [bacterium]|nr:DUF3179 domain-containing protein [bacterium]
MQLSVVYGREIDGAVTTFGTTGYTYDNTFVLYDRATESIWYPMDDGGFDAISGPRRGERIEFLAQPEIVSLADWTARHPETVVLLGSRSTIESREASGFKP